MQKKKLIPIVETIILCGRQNLALRGHLDSGRISGHYFRAFLRYRVKVDWIFCDHLENSPGNAMYISPKIQNELVGICHDLISKQLVERINKSKAFSILADKTTDIACIEQVTMCVRYVEKSEDNIHKIREEFLEFVPAADFSEEGLARLILKFLETSGIDCTNLIGQGYDGARAMSGQFHGARVYVQEVHKLAIYSHCVSHSFNLAVNAPSSEPHIRNAVGTIGSVYSFFHTPKRQLALGTAIGGIESLEHSKKKLKKLCQTRWVEQHELVDTYVNLQPAVVVALETIIDT